MVVDTKPYRSRRARPGDLWASTGCAWPKHEGALTSLGEDLTEEIHSRGERLVFGATPWIARAYERHGLTRAGRTRIGLRRYVSRP